MSGAEEGAEKTDRTTTAPRIPPPEQQFSYKYHTVTWDITHTYNGKRKAKLVYTEYS